MKKVKRIAVVIAAAFLVALMVSASAFAGHEEAVFLAAVFKDGSLEEVSPAVVVNENDSLLVLADISVMRDDAESYGLYSIQDDKIYNLTSWGQMGDYNLAVFEFQDQVPPESQILKPGWAKQGQTAELLYYTSEAVRSCRVRLTSAEEKGSFIELDFETMDEITSYPFFPAPLLDDAGGMLGLYVSTGNVIAFYTDLDTFYGGSAGEEETETETDTSYGRSGGEEETETAVGRGRSRGDSSAGTARGDSLKKDIITGGLIGVIAGIIGFIFVFVKKSGKPPKPVDGDIAGDSLADSTQDVPDRPVPRPVPAPDKPDRHTFGVTGTAGPLAGQAFVVEIASGLTFGRDASCSVRLPAETKGVSRIHCKLYLDGQGRRMLMDCGSSYGTHVKRNGTTKPVRLESNQPVAVNKGDKFYLGSNGISFMVQ